MVTKLGQFTKLGHFSFLNCTNFVIIFCQVLKMKIIFFDIPSDPPAFAVRNSLTNKFFQKNSRFCIFSKNKNKWKTEEKRRVISAFKIVQTLLPFVIKFWKWRKFFLISLAILRPSRSGIQWPINFCKKIDVSVYFQKKKKLWQVYIGISILVIPDHMKTTSPDWQNLP